jgi:hypothetical protein
VKEIFLQPKEYEVSKCIKETDEYMKTRFPVSQLYLYTAGGAPIVFTKPVGFDLMEYRSECQ